MLFAHYTEVEHSTYAIAILTSFVNPADIRKTYLDPYGMNPDNVMILSLFQHPDKKKTPQAEIKKYIIEELLTALNNIQAQYILCTDAEYFKALTRQSSAEPHLGYVLDCIYGPYKVIYAPSHRAMFYDPIKVKAKIDQGVNALKHHAEGTYQPPGSTIIKEAHYPFYDTEIKECLEQLLKYDELTCDIETFSLKPTTSGLGSITFCWNENCGVAFAIDIGFPNLNKEENSIRDLLRWFFETYQGKLIFHRATFDIHIIIYQLFMRDILDTAGLLHGLEVMCRDWECSQIVTYLATNSCSRNELGLKDQAREFAGNYAVDNIKDISKIHIDDLLKYNLIDGLSTWFTWNKNYPIMLQDQQQQVYEEIFKPAAMDIIQMQLTGLPVDMEKVLEAKTTLIADETQAINAMSNLQLIQAFTQRLRGQWAVKKNKQLKIKRVIAADSPEFFNPSSSDQLQDLLYNFLALPVLARTKSGLPSTDQDTIADLRNHTDDTEIITLIDALLNYKAVSKILTSVIPALEKATPGPDGWHYLLGNFNIGGTLSGRLSSSDPNLQNLPATGTKYAKIIKKCFVAAPGWLLVGVDFDSLEDKISALTTKDPNKLKVYTDGFDGHAYRAASYFKDKLEAQNIFIDLTDPKSVNYLRDINHPLRQDSKIPTFALTYHGTIHTLMNKSGFSRDMAKQIYDAYHTLYAASTKWISAKLDIAAETGYVTLAFGLRLRTPLLAQTIRGTKKTPYEAEAEGRTAGNAMGQSWCLLNSRAGSEFLGKVRPSKYACDIRPCAQIHDAQYYLIRDDIDVLMYTNQYLIKAVEWQQDPMIRHPQVKLSGKLALYHPSWAHEAKIPNSATKEQIFNIIDCLHFKIKS